MSFRVYVIALHAGVGMGCVRPKDQGAAPPVASSSARAADTAPTATDSAKEYRGEWESGFETSEFHGCDGTLPASVWLTFAPGARASIAWPSNNVGGAVSTMTYYVRVMGVLRGPAERRRYGAGYGHLGGSNYELYVTRVLEARPPGERNCSIQR